MKTLRIPIQLDSRRQLGVDTGKDAVRVQIIDVLVTAVRERAFRPGYGAGVPEMLYGTIDAGLFAVKEREIKQALEAYVVGGTIDSVRLSEDDQTRGTLQVSVAFRLTPGGPRYDVLQTFTGLVTEESF